MELTDLHLILPIYRYCIIGVFLHSFKTISETIQSVQVPVPRPEMMMFGYEEFVFGKNEDELLWRQKIVRDKIFAVNTEDLKIAED